MDATANDPPAGYEIEGYPTIVFKPAGNKLKKIPYDGPRDAKNMVDFIKSQKAKGA